jgi:hypothetical protein
MNTCPLDCARCPALARCGETSNLCLLGRYDDCEEHPLLRMEVRRAVMEQLGGLDLSWPRPITHHPVDDLPPHLPVLVQAYADPIDVPWIALHAGRVWASPAGSDSQAPAPASRGLPARPGHQAGAAVLRRGPVLEGVWLQRRSVIAQLAQLGFDRVLAPNVSVWRSDSRLRVIRNRTAYLARFVHDGAPPLPAVWRHFADCGGPGASSGGVGAGPAPRRRLPFPRAPGGPGTGSLLRSCPSRVRHRSDLRDQLWRQVCDVTDPPDQGVAWSAGLVPAEWPVLHLSDGGIGQFGLGEPVGVPRKPVSPAEGRIDDTGVGARHDPPAWPASDQFFEGALHAPLKVPEGLAAGESVNGLPQSQVVPLFNHVGERGRCRSELELCELIDHDDLTVKERGGGQCPAKRARDDKVSRTDVEHCGDGGRLLLAHLRELAVVVCDVVLRVSEKKDPRGRPRHLDTYTMNDGEPRRRIWRPVASEPTIADVHWKPAESDLDEAEPVSPRWTVDHITTTGPVGRLHRPCTFVVAKSRGRDADRACQFADSHLVLRHGLDASPSRAGTPPGTGHSVSRQRRVRRPRLVVGGVRS